jgi:nitroreductase
MTRAFRPEPVPEDALARCLDAGRRAPAAGNTVEGRAFLVVDEPARYWDVTLPGERRSAFAFPGLLQAPVLVVVCCRPAAYAERYAEADKARTATLGRGPAAWPQPLWWFDAGAAAEAILLQARADGLGACLFGLFDHEAAVLAAFGVPDGWRAACTIALGHPDEAAPAPPGRSAARRRATLGEVVHRGRWS